MSPSLRNRWRRVVCWLSLFAMVLFIGFWRWPVLESESGGGMNGPAAEHGLQYHHEEVEGCWVFTHLQKSGGETVKKIIANRWGTRHAVYDSEDWKMGDARARLFGQRLVTSRWNVVVGGYPETLRESVGSTCKWFTLFRHPVARLVSAYFYCKTLPDDWLCASQVVRAREIDLIGFARHWGNFAMRQFALNFVKAEDVVEFVKGGGVQLEGEDPLSLPGWYLLKMYLEHQGKASGKDEAAVMLDMVHPVRNLLHSNVSAVGILEEFDQTLELYDVALQMPGLEWVNEFRTTGMKNVDRKYKVSKNVLLKQAWINTDIKDYIGLDLLLYEHAVDVFREQVEHYGL